MIITEFKEVKMRLNLKHFWKVLPMIFTKDFWVVNKILKLQKVGCLYRYKYEIYEIKKWAKKKGYSWDNSWYLDGEKYLYKNKIPVCMIQPFTPRILTGYKAHQPDYEKYLVTDKTFLLNHHKTAKALFMCLNKEREYLFDRDKLCEKINSAISKKDKKYLNSDEFLSDLAKLSFGNYYDILALKNNTNLSAKEKKAYIGDYCDYDIIHLKDYITFEEADEKTLKGEDFDWQWTADFVPSGLTKGAIDSVICINPEKIHGLKVTPQLLKRLHKMFFNGLPTKRKI